MTEHVVDTATGELSVIEANSALSARDVMGPSGGVITTKMADTVENRLTVYNAITEPVSLSEASEDGPVEIELAAIVVQDTQFRDTTDRLVDGVATYLVDKSGDSYISVSTGIASGVAKLIGAFGDDPTEWPAGLTVTPRKKGIGKGKTTWSLPVSITKPKK